MARKKRPPWNGLSPYTPVMSVLCPPNVSLSMIGYAESDCGVGAWPWEKRNRRSLTGPMIVACQ